MKKLKTGAKKTEAKVGLKNLAKTKAYVNKLRAVLKTI